jgi:hypothetical protein
MAGLARDERSGVLVSPVTLTQALPGRDDIDEMSGGRIEVGSGQGERAGHRRSQLAFPSITARPT